MTMSTEDKVYADRLEQAIEFKTRRVRRLHKMKSLAETDGWKALKEDLEEAAKTQEAMNAQDLDAEESTDYNAAAEQIKLKRRAAAAKAYRSVVANVEHSDDKARSVNEQIARHKEDLRNLTEKSSPKTHPGRIVA